LRRAMDAMDALGVRGARRVMDARQAIGAPGAPGALETMDAAGMQTMPRRSPNSGVGFGWAQGMAKTLATPLLKGLRMLGRARCEVQLELLETLALGGRRQVFLIACGGQQYLVGAGPEQVGCLLQVSAGAAVPAAGQAIGSMPEEMAESGERRLW
jgi:hypothetical protein